jgi:AcrR family transcriptional regulator
MAKTKKAFQSEQSRAAILAAAMSLISKYGFNGTTVDKIAAEAGLSKGSIFWHFENKENLFLAVIEAIRNGLFQGLMMGQTEGLSARERVDLLLDNYAALIETDCSRCLDLTVLIIEMVETNPGLGEELRDLFAQLADMLASLLEEGKRSGEIERSVDSGATAYAIVGNLQGMTVQYYLNRDKFEYGRLMKAYRNLVLNGLFPH